MALFRSGLELLARVEANEVVRTEDFLDVCRLVLQAVDHLGTGFLLVKSDVGGNIDRLAARASTNPSKYSENVYAIVLDEVEAGDQAGSSSCTKGLLWLTRAMIFVVGLLQRLLDHPEETLSAAASEAYYATLQKYHGWIVTGTFTVALKIVPSSSFEHLTEHDDIGTQEFVDACESVFPIFNALGSVFLLAKSEFSSKRDSIAQVAQRLPRLRDIVEQGKVDATITVKNSPGRNLHRLLTSIHFIGIIFQNLAAGMAMKEAVSDSYDKTLALMHTWVVRAGIKAGMIALPSREDFLLSIGETEQSARQHVDPFVRAAEHIQRVAEVLYQGVTMPRSDFSFPGWWS
ncbi:hypothetical protein QBZ16_002303 [Prototheca wickerhamii]|uniref:Glycolipid transfer protein domain-containing protein n=1 Tax=Prototheca wickerhamii TaxID=3111 RepID=A0AAD9MMM3_PROWI|nr:hypothetical protein QBZ16_002303 [Prototheca wickerhamii]